MKPVRMLTSAEGEFSLSAGRVYNLPEPLADSFLEAGYAELPEDGEKVLTVTPNETAPHHRNDYQEFNPGARRFSTRPRRPRPKLADRPRPTRRRRPSRPRTPRPRPSARPAASKFLHGDGEAGEAAGDRGLSRLCLGAIAATRHNTPSREAATPAPSGLERTAAACDTSS
jgi:hypothetical protein